VDEGTIGPDGCISPSDKFVSGCIHYACRECWKRVSKCFVCQIQLPVGFMKTSEEILNEWISYRDPLSVTTLNLNNNRIVDLTPLASLTNLKTLDLSSNKISDTSPISILVNLIRLKMSFNYVKSFTPLASLIGTTNMVLSYMMT
jgi:Leucine-rich repeat (LRR) protein